MKIKKKFLALCSSLLALCACGKTYEIPPIMGNGGDTGAKPADYEQGKEGQQDQPKELVPVDVYLVLSSIGLYNGEKGKIIEDKMLENAVIYTAKPGEDLPNKEQVTTISGSKGEFEAWVSYEGTGFPTVYTKVPEEAGKILYATYTNTDNSGGGTTPIDPSNPNKLTTIYLDATQHLNPDDDQTWASGDADITMFTWSYTTGDSKWTKMNNAGTGFYSADVDLEKYTNVIFLRHAKGATPSFEDGGYWNKTGDLLFIADKNCFKITSWNNGGYWTNK